MNETNRDNIIDLMNENTRLRAEVKRERLAWERLADDMEELRKRFHAQRAEVAETRKLLQEARGELEYWTPDETMCVSAAESEALNGYYALRDRIDAALAKEKNE